MQKIIPRSAILEVRVESYFLQGMKMSTTSERVSAALADVIDPATTRKQGPATIKNSTVQLNGSQLDLTLSLDYPSTNDPAKLREQLDKATHAKRTQISLITDNNQQK